MKRQYGFITFLKWALTFSLWLAVFLAVGIRAQEENGITQDNSYLGLIVSIPVAIAGYFAIKNILYLLIPKYREHKTNYKQWKKDVKAERNAQMRAKNQPDSEIIKIEMLGTNQAFNTSFVSGITYNETEYTVKVTYKSGDSNVKKVKGSWLSRYSDLIETH